MWPCKSKVIGHPVHINCGTKPPEFRKRRAETRIENLTAKLERLKKRKSNSIMLQEMANTKTAIISWGHILEVADLELEQQTRGIES